MNRVQPSTNNSNSNKTIGESSNSSNIPQDSSGDIQRVNSDVTTTPTPNRTIQSVRHFFHLSGQFVSSAFRKFITLHWTPIRVVIGILVFALLIMQGICTTSMSWINMNEVYRQGLFKMCYHTFGHEISGKAESSSKTLCTDVPESLDYLSSTQSLMIVGILVYLTGFVYYLFMLYTRWLLSSVLTAVLAFNVVLITTALILFTDANRAAVTDTDLVWGWAYIVTWFNVIVTMVTAALAFLDEKFYKTNLK